MNIGYEYGEMSGQRSAPLRRRDVYDPTQPTVMSQAGMHALPPVSVRVPIADQYAIGIATPDAQSRQVDPTQWRRINGSASPVEGAEERRAFQMEMRQRMLAKRLYESGSVV